MTREQHLAEGERLLAEAWEMWTASDREKRPSPLVTMRLGFAKVHFQAALAAPFEAERAAGVELYSPGFVPPSPLPVRASPAHMPPRIPPIRPAVERF